MNDGDVLRGIANGDTESFEQLYNKYRADIYRFILSMTGSREAAEDLTQDVFVTVAVKAHTYKTNISVKAWLLTIARNRTLNHIKRESRESSLEEEPADKRNHFSTGSKEDMLGRLEILSESQKQIVIFHAVYEITHKDIAAMMNMSHAAVRKQYERAIKSLKAAYKEDRT